MYTVTHLAVVCDQCGPKLTPREKDDVNKYLEIRAQMPALDTLIRLAIKSAELENSKCRLGDPIQRQTVFFDGV